MNQSQMQSRRGNNRSIDFGGNNNPANDSYSFNQNNPLLSAYGKGKPATNRGRMNDLSLDQSISPDPRGNVSRTNPNTSITKS